MDVDYLSYSTRREGDYFITVLPNGNEVVADLREQPGQRRIADEMGCTVEEMNSTHDLFHSLVADALGLVCSPALWMASRGESSDLSGLEEEAILAVQKFYFAAVKQGWKK